MCDPFFFSPKFSNMQGILAQNMYNVCAIFHQFSQHEKQHFRKNSERKYHIFVIFRI